MSLQDLFQLKCLIENVDVRHCARVENGVKQLLAVITDDGDILLYYTFGDLPAVVKYVPWLREAAKSIQALCFDSSASWLLVVTLDGSLYILPALSLIDKKQRVDCKWALNDVTHFARHSNLPEARPLCVVWWQTIDCNQNALVGYETGCIGLVSLTDGRCLGTCSISESVLQMHVCQDNSLETTILLINGENGQQWKLVLENRATGFLWPAEASVSEETSKSRLFSLKQMGAEKLASLKLKFTEGKLTHSRRNSQTSDTNSEGSSHAESAASGPELLPHLCDTYFSAQLARNRYLFCAFYRPSSLLTAHALDVDTAPLYAHKLPAGSNRVLLTDRLIFIVDDAFTTLTIVSSQRSECTLDGDVDFNPDALVAQFALEGSNERIVSVFKLTDMAIMTKTNACTMPKNIDDVSIPKTKIDTCVVVTNIAVYKIEIRSPVKQFLSSIYQDWDLATAERIALVFGLNMHQMLEICGDLFIANEQYHRGLMLYKKAKVHLLKRVLKMAIAADCKSLLHFINVCLGSSKVDMSMVTKIHIGNLAVMAHTEVVLRHTGQKRQQFTNDFMKFLCYEEYYDQVLAVNVACQAGQWHVVTLLAKSRGLQPEVVAALSQVLQSAHSVRESVGRFDTTLSEPSLTQSLLIYPAYALPILMYVRNHVDEFSVANLKRFYRQLNPSQPAARPIIAKLLHHNKKQLAGQNELESTLDSIDFDLHASNIVVKDFIETFILVALHLVEKTGDATYNINLLEKLIPIGGSADGAMDSKTMFKFPPLRPLSCGYEHAAVIRNNHVYTMGMATAGCLGTGPLLTQSSAPKLVQTLQELKVKALSVACGRKHTLALTDFGVYAWGSNSFGQLGLGPFVQETPYPQLVAALSDKHIVDICCGQYHSLALSAAGELFTWGWGIHGQLGHGNCDNQVVPAKVAFPSDIAQIAAGHAHSIILDGRGKVFGFGSNCFGQLGSADVSKSPTPLRIMLAADLCKPVERISTSYFHNIAVLVDQEVLIWGANPQEVRVTQAKFSQKMSSFGCKLTEPWKQIHHVYSGKAQKGIEDVATGYRHCAILHSGQLLWGRGREGDLDEAKIREHDFPGALGQKFTHIACGPDFIMALENSGKVLAWGSNSMAQTILGKPYEEQRQPDGKIVIFKNTKRFVKIPGAVAGNGEGYPFEVPGLPTMAINYNITDPRFSAVRNCCSDGLLGETSAGRGRWATKLKSAKGGFDASFIESVPSVSVTQKTLHLMLEKYLPFYDSELVLNKCLHLNNSQAASKVAILNEHFGDSLIYQLKAFNHYMEAFTLELDLHPKADEYDINTLGELCTKMDFTGIKFEFSAVGSPARILSTSSSLDSIRQWDDLDHQGGCESPCEMNDLGDIKQSMTQYVRSVRNDNAPAKSVQSVSQLVDHPLMHVEKGADVGYAIDAFIKDAKTKEIVKIAAFIIEYYIHKTYNSDNHILMQNILLKAIEFWLRHNLPVPILEMVLVKNMDKYFYPLSILLFCKNFNNNLGDELVQNGGFHRQSSAGFLKEFSTKFCLHLCSMVLENVNKS